MNNNIIPCLNKLVNFRKKKKPENTGFLKDLFPLIFRILLWLIYAQNIISNGNFEPVFPLIISFIKNFVAENVAKSPAE